MEDLTPRERRHLRTKEAILDAARQIIHESGTDALSIRAIANRIDYSPAGLYEYYGSKEEIITAVCEQGHMRFSARLSQVDASLPADEYVMALGHAYIAFAMQYPDYYQLMFTNPAPSPQQPDDIIEPGSAFNILLNGIQRAIDEGMFPAKDDFSAMEMAYTAWANVHGLAMLRIVHMTDIPLDYDKLEAESITTMVTGLKHR